MSLSATPTSGANSLRGTLSKGLSIVALAVAAMAAFVASPSANAAIVPAHTRPVLVNTLRSSYYGTCQFDLSNPRVWGITTDPSTEFLAWVPIAHSAATGYLYGSQLGGFASGTSGNPPFWYYYSLGGFYTTKTGTVSVPQGPAGYPRYYWLGFQIQSQGVWLNPSDQWLFRVSC